MMRSGSVQLAWHVELRTIEPHRPPLSLGRPQAARTRRSSRSISHARAGDRRGGAADLDRAPLRPAGADQGAADRVQSAAPHRAGRQEHDRRRRRRSSPTAQAPRHARRPSRSSAASAGARTKRSGAGGRCASAPATGTSRRATACRYDPTSHDLRPATSPPRSASTLGDIVTVVAPRTRLTPFGPVPVWQKYRIARLVTPASDERARRRATSR